LWGKKVRETLCLLHPQGIGTSVDLWIVKRLVKIGPQSREESANAKLL
jgi:hypothetical protein